MTIPAGWEGICAPLLYVAQCSKKDTDRYVLASRIWILPNVVAFIALLVALIRRWIRVTERFNTLRLLMLKFMLGLPWYDSFPGHRPTVFCGRGNAFLALFQPSTPSPLELYGADLILTAPNSSVIHFSLLKYSIHSHILFDILRAFSPNAFGVSPSFTSFLWVTGWVPPISGMLLLTVTWMSFSSKSLLARPVITGNWYLYLAFMIPYVVSSLPLAAVSGISFKVYRISMRASMASWSAMFLMLFACCFWFGRRTLKHLKATGDKFVMKQQLRAYLVISGTLLAVGLCLGFNAFFLDEIDKRITWFLLITTWYRLQQWFIFIGCSIYVWVSTTRWKSSPAGTGRVGSTRSTDENSFRREFSVQRSPRPQNTSSSSKKIIDTTDTSTTSSSESHDTSATPESTEVRDLEKPAQVSSDAPTPSVDEPQDQAALNEAKEAENREDQDSSSPSDKEEDSEDDSSSFHQDASMYSPV